MLREDTNINKLAQWTLETSNVTLYCRTSDLGYLPSLTRENRWNGEKKIISDYELIYKETIDTFSPRGDIRIHEHRYNIRPPVPLSILPLSPFSRTLHIQTHRDTHTYNLFHLYHLPSLLLTCRLSEIVQMCCVYLTLINN